MIKKSIVIIQLVIVLVLGVLIVGQLGISPEKAKRINRKEPLWFMAPWRPEGKDGASGAAATPPAQESPDPSSRDMVNRHYILTPGPALNAIVTELENKDLESESQPFVSSRQSQQAQPEIHKKGKKTPEPRKAAPKPAPAGPIAVTALSVVPSGNNVVLKGLTSAPVASMEVLTFASPPRMILELHGHFTPFDEPMSIPPNAIIQSVTTTVSENRMRITAALHTSKVSITPALRSGHGSEFVVELLLQTTGKPQAGDNP